MLKLFDKSHNAIGHLVKYKDCKIESELSTGDKTLSFTYLAKHHNLENEMYVRTQKDEFVIKEVPATTGSFPQIVAILNLEDLQRDMWERFSVTDVTIDEAVRTVLTGTGWTIGECDVTKRRNAGMIQVSTLEVIQKLCTAFMCEPVFDTINKKVSFYSKRGEDKGIYFMSGLNLKKLQKKVTSYDYYTRIIPIGSNGLTIETVNDGKKYLENYQYSNKILTYVWKDESYTDPQALKEDAELKLEDLSKPEKAYSAEIYNLAKQKPGYSILSYGLGDTVILIDQETGTKEKQRIVKTVEYPQDHNKDTCEIANTLLTFEEMQQKVQSAAEIINYTITGDGRYTGTINVSDILHFEQGIAGSSTIGGINSSISTMQGDLGEIKTKVGEIETNYLKADEAELKYATIENLDVTNQTVHSIQGDYASFKTMVTEEFSAQTGIIDNLSGELSNFKTSISNEMIAAKGWMLEGSIGDAQISDVSANKLSAGTVDTAIVTVAGTDGRLQIVDNTIQIRDDNRVRVQVGKDASGDYTLAVWDSFGKLIWDALGATENTIQRQIIRDKMVADDAAIQALKLDLRSFDTAMTQQGVTISGTVVQVGDKTLDVTLTEQTQLISEQGETLTDHAARIAANEDSIKLKVSAQEYSAFKSEIGGEISSAKNRLSTTESSITAMQGQITLKVEQTDIDTAIQEIEIGGRNLIKKTAYAYTSSRGVAITYSNDGYVTVQGTTNEGNNISIAKLNDIKGLSGNYTFSAERIAGEDITFVLSLYQGRVKKEIILEDGEDSITFDGTGYDLGFVSIVNTVIGREIDAKARFMLEKGTKRTAWKPAPEDIQSEIDLTNAAVATHAEKISTHDTRITAAEDAINLKVSTTDFDSYKTTVSDELTSAKSRLSATESSITAMQGKIALKVEQTDIDKAVKTVNDKFTSYSTTTQMTAAINAAKDSITSAVSQTYAEKSEVSAVSGKVTSLESWKAEASQKITKDGIVATVGNYYAYQTDLEDTTNWLSSVETIATQTSEKFSWIVKSGTNSTDFTLTDRTATLVANAINLKGLVSFSGLDSDTRSEIITVKATADATDAALTALCYDNNRAYIDGGKIYAKSIKAAQIDVTDLFAQDITATGTITGLNLVGGSLIIGEENYSGDYSKISPTGKTFTSDIYSRSGYSICYYDRSLLGGSISESDYKRIIAGDASKLVIGKSVYIEDELSSTVDYTTNCGMTMDGTNLSLYGRTIVKNDAYLENALTVAGESTLNGETTVNGNLKFKDYTGTMRSPASTVSTDGNRVGVIATRLSSGTREFRVSGQWGTAGSTYTVLSFQAASSDIRIKENIRTTETEALPVLKAIELYQFDYKDDHSHQSIGFVADYLEKIDKRFSIGGGYDEYGNMDIKQVNEFYLMGYAVKGIQELCDWTTRLDNQTVIQSDRIARLDSQITTMDAKYQSKTSNLETQLESVQYQLQQAFARITEQEKLIKQLQAAG